MSMQAVAIRESFPLNHKSRFPTVLAKPATRLFGLTAASLSFGRNEEVYGEGEPAEYIYTVQSGCVRTSKILSDGRRQIGAFYLSGEVFGLEAGDEHSFSAETLEPTIVRFVKRSRVACDSAMTSQLLDLTGAELQRTQEHILLLIKSAQERVVSFLIEMAKRTRAANEIDLPMSRQDIADYLGLTIETVSRTLTQLANAGAIVVPSSRHIVLRNRAALNRLST